MAEDARRKLRLFRRTDLDSVDAVPGSVLDPAATDPDPGRASTPSPVPDSGTSEAVEAVESVATVDPETPPETEANPVIDQEANSAAEPTPVSEPAEPPSAAEPQPVKAKPEPQPPTMPDIPPEMTAAPLPMVLPRIVAIANQKGGVGKTTTSVNLGAGLAELGFRVLVVDLDPQGNASTGLGINHRNVQGSIYDVLMNGVAVEDCVEPTAVRNLFVVPATIDLAGAEIELVPAMSRELKLKKALAEVSDDYDFTLIDCPPSLGLLTVNGLAAATDVIVPIQCEYSALEGLGQWLRNVSLVRGNLNPALEVRGIVLTMYDARTNLAEQVEHEVRHHFGPIVYRTVVPRTVRISEAPSFGQPVTVFDPSSRGAIAYRELAKEVSRGASRRSG